MRRILIAVVRGLSVLPQLFAGIAVLAALAIGIVWGTHSAGGADSYGYISQAALWAQGRISVPQPFVRDFPWQFADWTFTPLGYRPGTDRASIVPTYPAGLPIVMAAFQLVGGPSAVFLVPPLAAALSVWLTFWIARHLGGAWAGALAAVLLAFSPTFAFQAVLPMSDISAGMWWMAAVGLAFHTRTARRPLLTALLSGLMAALALLTRPNLVLVAIPLVFFYLTSRDLKRLAAFVIGAAPGPIAIAILHTVWYGSPIKSGYGTFGELYAWEHALQNLTRYPLTFVRYEQPIAAVAVLGTVMALIVRRRAEAAYTWTLVGVMVAVCLSYLFYVPFPEWWYLRFLLPAYPALCCLVAVAATKPVRVLPPIGRVAAAAAIIMGCGVWGFVLVRAVGTHEMKHIERRYRDVGEFIARSLPANAVFFSVQESGSIRYYSGRLTVRFDWIQPDELDDAVARLRAHGFHPYIALEPIDDEQFRTRFRGHSVLADLDWPPAAMRRLPVRVRIYDPADRDRYLRGAAIRTLPIETVR